MDFDQFIRSKKFQKDLKEKYDILDGKIYDQSGNMGSPFVSLTNGKDKIIVWRCKETKDRDYNTIFTVLNPPVLEIYDASQIWLGENYNQNEPHKFKGNSFLIEKKNGEKILYNTNLYSFTLNDEIKHFWSNVSGGAVVEPVIIGKNNLYWPNWDGYLEVYDLDGRPVSWLKRNWSWSKDKSIRKIKMKMISKALIH